MSKIYSILIFITISISLNSQSITNVQSVRDGDNIVINYTLDCDSTSIISLFTSEDGGNKWIGPLKSVTGDVGVGISQGKKSIIWNVTQDVEIFSGDNILFKVIGVGFGNIVLGSLIDNRDEMKYKTVKIGKQIWMAENLNYEINGSFCYSNGKDNCNEYGRLYTWEAAKKVCPTNWHLPSDTEWKQLIDLLGGELLAGTKLKSKSKWEASTVISTDKFGFSALPGGFCTDNGTFRELSRKGAWWSATELNSSNAIYRIMSFDQNYINRLDFSKRSKFSIRCIQN